MAKREKADTSEVSTKEEKVSTSTSEVDKMSLNEYLKLTKVNPGLIASFTYEARFEPDLLLPKSDEEWKRAFDAQSKRTYK